MQSGRTGFMYVPNPAHTGHPWNEAADAASVGRCLKKGHPNRLFNAH
jgi:hypothetical protein